MSHKIRMLSETTTPGYTIKPPAYPRPALLEPALGRCQIECMLHLIPG